LHFALLRRTFFVFPSLVFLFEFYVLCFGESAVYSGLRGIKEITIREA
jgi:hypothetical protein